MRPLSYLASHTGNSMLVTYTVQQKPFVTSLTDLKSVKRVGNAKNYVILVSKVHTTYVYKDISKCILSVQRNTCSSSRSVSYQTVWYPSFNHLCVSIFLIWRRYRIFSGAHHKEYAHAKNGRLRKY
jgi:hypothetical protein